VYSGSLQEKEVLQTFYLLKETYLYDSLISNKVFDIPKLKKNWHIILFKDIFTKPGEIRTSGVETNNIDGSKHIYPHHTIINENLKRLGYFVFKLAEKIELLKDSKKLLYSFALASFAQFHFVDIHPFIDGNGRLCRFISKYILDTMCPIPFPMFTSRKKYIKTIEKGRTLTPLEVPKFLCNLLLDTALEFYKNYVTQYTNWIPKIYFVACDIDQLEKQLNEKKK